MSVNPNKNATLLLASLVMFANGRWADGATLFSTEINRNTLVTLDSVTGLPTEIGTPGALGFGNVSGIAFQPGTGVLYGVSGTSDRLITIDPLTGIGTAAGTGVLGLGAIFGGIEDIAFAPDGTLYGVDPIPATLVSIDLTTGAATAIPGNPPFALVSYGGMAFSPDGTLFATDSANDILFTVDVITGVFTQIGVLQANNQNVDSISGIAFSPDGTLFGVGFGPRSLVTINPATAEVTLVADNGLTLISLEFEPGAVPEPGTLALAVPLCGVLCGVLLRRRPKRAGRRRTRPHSSFGQ